RHVSLALLLNPSDQEQRFRPSDETLSFRRVVLQTAEVPMEMDQEGQWTLPARSLCLLASSSAG
ncbi:hypothetical protein, partial [Stenotrophomonas sp. NPDC077659]|uniref:hypothetical protein n=1 Tax=Stenotrophomonas sp. NPDC077659 TaxID=3390694 RepID=UPI003D063B1C